MSRYLSTNDYYVCNTQTWQVLSPGEQAKGKPGRRNPTRQIDVSGVQVWCVGNDGYEMIGCSAKGISW